MNVYGIAGGLLVLSVIIAVSFGEKPRMDVPLKLQPANGWDYLAMVLILVSCIGLVAQAAYDFMTFAIDFIRS